MRNIRKYFRVELKSMGVAYKWVRFGGRY
jgi:hypothetical protein